MCNTKYSSETYPTQSNTSVEIIHEQDKAKQRLEVWKRIFMETTGRRHIGTRLIGQTLSQQPTISQLQLYQQSPYPQVLVPQLPHVQSNRKRYRNTFTTDQIQFLEIVFRDISYVSLTVRDLLCKTLRLPPKVIKIWFQNRRMRQKKINEALSIFNNENGQASNTEAHNQYQHTFIQPMSHSPAAEITEHTNNVFAPANKLVLNIQNLQESLNKPLDKNELPDLGVVFPANENFSTQSDKQYNPISEGCPKNQFEQIHINNKSVQFQPSPLGSPLSSSSSSLGQSAYPEPLHTIKSSDFSNNNPTTFLVASKLLSSKSEQLQSDASKSKMLETGNHMDLRRNREMPVTVPLANLTSTIASSDNISRLLQQTIASVLTLKYTCQKCDCQCLPEYSNADVAQITENLIKSLTKNLIGTYER